MYNFIYGFAGNFHFKEIFWFKAIFSDKNSFHIKKKQKKTHTHTQNRNSPFSDKIRTCKTLEIL